MFVLYLLKEARVERIGILRSCRGGYHAERWHHQTLYICHNFCAVIRYRPREPLPNGQPAYVREATISAREHCMEHTRRAAKEMDVCTFDQQESIMTTRLPYDARD